MVNQKAFTLLELCVCMAIAGCILIFSIPTFEALKTQHQRNFAINQMVAALSLARSEAIFRHQTVVLCASKEDGRCDTDWTSGMLLFAKGTTQGDDFKEGDHVLRFYGPLRGGDRWLWNRAQAPIVMQASGMLKSGNGTFIYYPKDHSSITQAVIVSMTGRVRVSAPMHFKIPTNARDV